MFGCATPCSGWDDTVGCGGPYESVGGRIDSAGGRIDSAGGRIEFVRSGLEFIHVGLGFVGGGLEFIHWASAKAATAMVPINIATASAYNVLFLFITGPSLAVPSVG